MKRTGADAQRITVGQEFLNELKNREVFPITPLNFLTSQHKEVLFYQTSEQKRPIRFSETTTTYRVELTGYSAESKIQGSKNTVYSHAEISFEVEVANDFSKTVLVNDSINYGVLSNMAELPAYLVKQEVQAGPAS